MSLYDWPGNVRELENAMGHACMMVLGDTIDVGDLPPYLGGNLSRFGSAEPLASAPEDGSSASMLEEAERHLISGALARASGNKSEAARLLRMGRNALCYKTKKYALASQCGLTDSHGGSL